LDAQVGWGGNNTGRKYGVSKLEECISAAMEAFVEGAAELAQGIEAIGRFHGGSFCYRQVREATSWRRFVPEQLKRKLRGCADRDTIRLLERRAQDARSSGELPSFPMKERTRARTPTIPH
jgi:hypothetical protein